MAGTDRKKAATEASPVPVPIAAAEGSSRSWEAVFLLAIVLAIGAALLQGSPSPKVSGRQLTETASFKTVVVYDNGMSVGGIKISLEPQHAPSGAALAAYLSEFVAVDGIRLVGEPEDAKIVADRIYTGGGKLVESYDDIEAGDRLYTVAPGLLFVWPFVKVGHRVRIEAVLSPTGRPIVLESLSETPRVFHVHDFFSDAEADALVARILTIDGEHDKLQQSHVGHKSGAKVVSPHRTSENAFDQVSPPALAIRKRSFDLLRIPKYQDDMCDGLQLLRYQQKQAYIAHTDYFAAATSDDWNWNPKVGGSNRFATVFLYLSNVTAGGQTVFPLAEMPEGVSHPPSAADARGLFDPKSWEADMVQSCSTRLASYPRKTHAILFYSQKPNGALDPRSLHGGCPVLEGTKWAANLWVWNKRRYGLDAERPDVIKVKFVNPTDGPVDLFYADTKLATVKPRGEQPFTSYAGHSWTMKDASGAVLGQVVLSAANGASQTITAGEAATT
ncbi:hypothetical protein ACHHYP_15884 [Achlya hypogyna]|uniref:Fe2OG dioxygenase domain-containing protein n=1 Tax=Achlya hypogyna TaxID=1202772 RepID=A0A1V9YA28_ACHHY|nr:hypothetical protein ACHHYP_15884 [Achlya hypogyna]